jgi:hypothetical protein
MEKQFRHYWFETGTPSFLLELIKQQHYNVMDLSALKLSSASFSTYEIENLKLEPLLFQTGYLTIKDYSESSGIYTLSFPNDEVKGAFINYISGYFTPIKQEFIPNYIVELQMALEQGNIIECLNIIKVFFANIEYDLHIQHERYYQTIFYIIFTLLGISIEAEVKTNQGRIDAVVKTKTGIYIFEFKLFASAESAMQQMKDKKYYQKYLLDERKIILIGAGFDPITRNIEKYLIETIKTD